MAKKKKGRSRAEEKKYIVGLQPVYLFPRKKRARKAITLIKRFVFKHTRIGEEDVLISNKLNEAIWQYGREHIPRKLAIKVIEAEGKANVFLQSEKVKPPAKEEKKGEKKKEEKTPEEIAAEEEKKRKEEEKKMVEKAAEAAAIKRGSSK